MTAAGHEAVKADLVKHLTDHLGDWITVVAVDGWPPAPGRIAAADVLPVDEDKPWPCIHVATTGRTPDSTAGDVFVSKYAAKITVAVRSSKDDVEAATGRDRLVQAVEWLFRSHPQAGTSSTVLTAGMADQIDPVAVDPKGRPVALGIVTVDVRHVETVPDLASYGASDKATVVVDAVPADGSLSPTSPTDRVRVTVTAE